MGIGRLVVFRDINSEEPTESMDLDGALESRRHGTPALLQEIKKYLLALGSKGLYVQCVGSMYVRERFGVQMSHPEIEKMYLEAIAERDAAEAK